MDYIVKHIHGHPRAIKWHVVAGDPNLNYWQSFDTIFDEKDLKIRGMEEVDGEIRFINQMKKKK